MSDFLIVCLTKKSLVFKTLQILWQKNLANGKKIERKELMPLKTKMI